MALNLGKTANRVGIKINSRNIKIFDLMIDHTLPICINKHNVDGVEQLYLLESFLPTVVPNLTSFEVSTTLNPLLFFNPEY